MSITKKMLIALGVLYLIAIVSTMLQNLVHEEFELLPLNNQLAFQRFMEGHNFRGTWKSNRNSSLLEHPQGMAQVYFTRHPNPSNIRINSLNPSEKSVMVMWIHDPIFRDDKLLKITNYVVFGKQDDLISFSNEKSTNFNIITFEDTLYTKELNCSLTGKVSISNETLEKDFLNTTAFKIARNAMNISIKAEEECNLNIEIILTTSPITTSVKSILYTMFLITIVILNWFGAIKIINEIFEDFNYTNKLSLYTALFACCQDSFILIFNLTFGINFSSDFNYFMIFFIYFVLIVR